MPRLSKTKLLLSVSLCASLLSCTPHPPAVYVFEPLEQRLAKDPATGHLMLEPSPACMSEIGEIECLHGVNIMTGKEIYVGDNKENRFNGKKASQLRNEMVCLPAEESFAPLQTYIINSCRQMHCDQDVEAFRVRLESLRAVK